MGGACKEVGRFWVTRIVERNTEKLALRQAVFLEKDRYNVNSNDVKAYFDRCRTQLAMIPFPFVSNADETQVGAPKKRQPLRVLVSAQTGPGHITVPETRDDPQLTLLTATSAFGDSAPPSFVSKNTAFEKKRLADFEMHEEHDYRMRTAPNTFITEVLFLDWLKSVFLPWTETRRQRRQYQGPIILLLDGHSTHVTPRVLASADSQRIIIIQLVAHSSHLT
jgi:hypothetical protein